MRIGKNKPQWREILFFLLLFVFLSVLSIKMHYGRGTFNWKSEIWADKAGYYMYLPATFFFHFDTKKVPQGLDEKTGYGFSVDRQKNVISTQYFYGVSLMVAPFFFSAHLYSKIAGRYEQDGFSDTFQKFSDIAAVFYLILGLFFLKKFLRHYFRESLQYFIILATFLGTNLFYYAMDDGLMSHVYSFFTVAFFLFAMKEFLMDQTRYRYFLLMTIAFALMFIIRPTNCLVGLLFLFWDVSNRKEILSRIQQIISPRYLFPLLAIMFLLILPQLLYWKMVHGTFIYLKYGEKFIYWNHPKILEVWFSTLNGLIPWSPLILLYIAGMIFMVTRKIKNGIPILVMFLLISYMAASYRYWYFGCGHGHRAFVEFYPLFCIPFGFLADKIFTSANMARKVFFAFLMLFMIYMNIGLTIFGEKCFFGSTWDWNQYSRVLERIYLYPASARQFEFINDFENSSLFGSSMVSDSIGNSGNWNAVLDKDHETCCEHTIWMWDFYGKIPKFITARISVKKVNHKPVHAFLVCSFWKDDIMISQQTQQIDPFVRDSINWFIVCKTFMIPDRITGDTRINVYVLNKERNEFFVDDLIIKEK